MQLDANNQTMVVLIARQLKNTRRIRLDVTQKRLAPLVIMYKLPHTQVSQNLYTVYKNVQNRNK